MNSKSRYKTKQRELLLGYFETVPGKHVTAADICAYLRSREESIGQSTVYRQLESLVDEGLIKKYIIDANSPACFEYVAPDSHGSGWNNWDRCIPADHCLPGSYRFHIFCSCSA